MIHNVHVGTKLSVQKHTSSERYFGGTLTCYLLVHRRPLNHWAKLIPFVQRHPFYTFLWKIFGFNFHLSLIIPGRQEGCIFKPIRLWMKRGVWVWGGGWLITFVPRKNHFQLTLLKSLDTTTFLKISKNFPQNTMSSSSSGRGCGVGCGVGSSS